MPQTYLHSLRRMAVFAGLKDESLKMLVLSATLVEREPAEYFYLENQPGDHLYVLIEGAVACKKIKGSGEIVLSRFYEGDCFGEMSLIDLMPRATSVQAITNSVALEVHRRQLFELYKNDLEQYAIIMMNMGREVSRRLRNAERRVHELHHAPNREVVPAAKMQTVAV